MTIDYETEYKLPYERHKHIEPIHKTMYNPVTTYKLTASGQEKYERGISIDNMVADEDFFIVPTIQKSSKSTDKKWSRDLRLKARQTK